MPIPSKPWSPPRPSHIRESAWKKIQSIKGDDLPKDREFLVRGEVRKGTYVVAFQWWDARDQSWCTVRPLESDCNLGYAVIGQTLGDPDYTEWCEVPS